LSLIRAIDLETSGEEPDAVDIVEVGWCSLIPVYTDSETPSFWDLTHPKSLLVKPTNPITPESSAVHHILDEDVQHADNVDDVLELALDGPHDMILAAHNASYEMGLIGHRNLRWIDTYKVAVVLAPQAPAFKLQVLRYWLELNIDRLTAAPAHRAGPDAYVCAALIHRILAAGKATVDEMVEISRGPIFLPRLMFGKHAKDPVAHVPSGYLEWILKENERSNPGEGFDENVVFTAETELENRRREGRKHEAY